VSRIASDVPLPRAFSMKPARPAATTETTALRIEISDDHMLILTCRGYCKMHGKSRFPTSTLLR
jgi:hypothetical protein